MMTIQTPHPTPHILFAVSEDPMEVTTDVNRHFEAGEDIDIDLDLPGDLQPDEEDEYMGDDDEELIDPCLVDAQNSNTANDDEMADGGYVEGSVLGRSSIHEEDLQDADDEPGIDEDPVVEVAVENPSDATSDLLDDEEHVDANWIHDEKHDTQACNVSNHKDEDYEQQLSTSESDVHATRDTISDAQKRVSNFTHGESRLINPESSLSFDENPGEPQQGTLAISHDETEPAIHEPSQDEHTEYHSGLDRLRHHRIEGTVTTSPLDLENAPNSKTEELEFVAPIRQKSAPSSNIDPESHDQPVASDGAFFAASNHVHPVVVVYQDNEISLFPPVTQKQSEDDETGHSLTFFLDDEQLARDSFQNLFEALRSALGESMIEQDELTIDIEDLGLHISEFSTDCSSSSLSEVIEIYVQLQHHDGLDSPPPLYLTLNTKARFSYRLESLQFAIADQRGLSQTRSSYAFEEPQQLEIEGVPGPHDRDDSLLADRDDKVAISSQDESARDSHVEEPAHNDPLASSSLLDESKPVSPPLKVNANVENTKRGNDEASTDSTTLENDWSVADGQRSEGPRIDSTRSSPQPDPPTGSEHQGLEKHIAYDDDFIDYQNDEEPAQGNADGPSTSLGETFGVTAYEILPGSEENISQVEPAELRGAGAIRKRTVDESKVTYDTLNEKSNDSIAIAREQEQPDCVDHRAEYLEYTGEQDNAASADEGARLLQDLQSGQPQNHDILLAENVDKNQKEGLKQSKQQLASLQTDASQEQQYVVSDGHDDLEVTQVDNEQENEDQSNANQADYDNTVSVLRNDDIQGETDDDNQDTMLGAPTLTPAIDSGDNDEDVLTIGKTEFQLSFDGRGHSHDDDDEITYGDEGNEEQTSTDSLLPDHKSAPSPGPLKRARRLHEDDDAIEDDLQDAKRIRSI